MANRISGVIAMERTPSTAITRNQIKTTGPNRRPIRPVPRFWIRKSPSRMTRVTGSTSGANSGSSSLMPSTAERTEIAGVSMPSPKKSASPSTPATPMMVFMRRDRPAHRCASEARAITPPSPLLSALRTKITYLMVTMMISDHRMREIAPSTANARRHAAAGRQHRLAHRIKRAGADVAVNDAQCPQREPRLPAAPGGARHFGRNAMAASGLGSGHQVHGRMCSRIIRYRLPARTGHE